MSEFIVSSVVLSPEGIEVGFMRLPDDARCDGQLIATRNYFINRDHPDFGEEVRDITDQLHDLVEDVHRAFDNQPLTYAQEGEDDLEGMGQG